MRSDVLYTAGWEAIKNGLSDGPWICSWVGGVTLSLRSIWHEQRARLGQARVPCTPDPSGLKPLRMTPVYEAASANRFENQLLHSPVQQLTDEEFVFRRARDFVNPAKLF